jgi:hypothetical protein
MAETRYIGRAYLAKEGTLDLETLREDDIPAARKAVLEPGVRVLPGQDTCNSEEALRLLHLLDRGTRESFLSGELGVQETADILARIKATKDACKAGDQSACVLLGQLIDKITEERG